MNDREYITRKVKHMKRVGIAADTNPKTGAARPEWMKALTEAREKRAKK